MRHCIGRLREVENDCIQLLSRVMLRQHVVCCHGELGLGGVVRPEAVVFLTQDVVGVGVAPDVRTDNVFQSFAGYGCQ